MNATVTKVSITTTKAPEFIDITEHVIAHVENSGVRDGLVSIYSIHTTCAIKINENEPLLINDMESFLKRIAPDDIYYAHNVIEMSFQHKLRKPNVSWKRCLWYIKIKIRYYPYF